MVRQIKYGLVLIFLWQVSVVSAQLVSDAIATPIEVTDFLGRQVRLEQPAQRIIALAPHITENVFSAGAGGQLVGVVSHSDYPEAAKSIPIVGGYRSFSLEAILALKPDLILMWSSGNSAATFDKIKQLGIPTYVDELSKLEDIARAIRDIAVLTGKEEVGITAADEFLSKLNYLQSTYSHLTPVSTLYQVWNEPLQTLNGEHIISNVIELCSGRNIFADAISLAPKISLESVFERDPAVIVASGMGESRPEWLNEWLQWPQLQAVQKENLYFVPPDLLQRHTTRILDGAEQMCLHLQAARDKDNEQ